jgi:predicted amidohydrolase
MTASATRKVLDAVPHVRSHVFEGRALLAPEPARAAALQGSDVLFWLRPPRSNLLLETARTRAMENRTYVALCTLADRKEATCLVGPDGNVVASALSGTPSGFVAVLDTLLARRKEVVPGTQTFADRMPYLYRTPMSTTRIRKAGAR